MITLEVCVDRFESLHAAIAGGAHRIELCAALDLGGLTPSEGLIATALDLVAASCRPVDVMVMIRPHSGDFHYSSDDIRCLHRDIETAKRLGAHGIVIGPLDRHRQIDRALVRDCLDAARPLSVTFHRAFDLVASPLDAVDQLAELGVARLLTSGQAPTAIAGADLIAQLVRRAGSSLAIIAAAGVHSQNAAELVRRTGVRELHASARSRQFTSGVGQPSLATFDFVHPRRLTDAAEVRAILEAIRD